MVKPIDEETKEKTVTKKSEEKEETPAAVWNRMSVTNFNMYASCPKSKVQPIVNIANNTITIPVAPDDPNCTKNYLDADGKRVYIVHEFSFEGTFKGGNTAPSASEEMAVFAGKDIVHWSEEEFGFVFTNNDKVLKAYAAMGGSEGYYKYEVIDKNPDSLEHTYKATIRREGNIIDFYIDDVLKGTITTNRNYNNIQYHVVVTTHRNVGGWDSDDYKVIVKNIKYR